MKYKEAEEKAREFINLPRNAPSYVYKFFAYKNGDCVTFDTEREAKEYSSLYERIHVNKEEIDKYLALSREFHNLAWKYWYSDLRQEYSYLHDKVFDICYDEAYERGHSGGYDEVGFCMSDIVQFAQRLFVAQKTD